MIVTRTNLRTVCQFGVMVTAAATITLILFHIASGQTPLTLVGTIELPGVEGRIDHLAVDGASQRLYVAAPGNNTVEVLDLKTYRHIKRIPGFREPQGVRWCRTRSSSPSRLARVRACSSSTRATIT